MPAWIDAEGLESLKASGAQIVEVLPRKEYRLQHLPDAINLPLKTLDRRSVGILDRSRAVVVYCADSL
jgi:rhodanese-related sulfurtransferase